MHGFKEVLEWLSQRNVSRLTYPMQSVLMFRLLADVPKDS